MTVPASTFALPADPRHLLDNYPLIRSRSAEEARELVGRALSPHRLDVRGEAPGFEARHNQIRLGQVSLNVLSYGTEVEIDPGERGDFYLIQLPLQGRARVHCDGQEAWVDPDMLSVLHPHAHTRMLWSGDCSMIMLQVPSAVLRRQLPVRQQNTESPQFSFTQSRHDPAVAAWWQAVADMTRNLHSHGAQWLRHPAAYAAMEGFLLTGLDLLRPERDRTPETSLSAHGGRHLQRALDYIQAHAHESLTLDRIAAAACVSPRTLEVAFRRRYDQSPLAYARGIRLDRVRAALQAAAADGRQTSVTDIALQHGFVHMGRFSAYYRRCFGCAPSETLRGV
jgi:AraC-like DNA-binding protein